MVTKGNQISLQYNWHYNNTSVLLKENLSLELNGKPAETSCKHNSDKLDNQQLPIYKSSRQKGMLAFKPNIHSPFSSLVFLPRKMSVSLAPKCPSIFTSYPLTLSAFCLEWQVAYSRVFRAFLLKTSACCGQKQSYESSGSLQTTSIKML